VGRGFAGLAFAGRLRLATTERSEKRYMFHFGVTTRRLPAREHARRRAIAKTHGAEWIGPVRIPGNDATGWFNAPNLGTPFDEAVARAVLADVGGSDDPVSRESVAL